MGVDNGGGEAKPYHMGYAQKLLGTFAMNTSRRGLVGLAGISYVYEVGAGRGGQGVGFPRSLPDSPFAICLSRLHRSLYQ